MMMIPAVLMNKNKFSVFVLQQGQETLEVSCEVPTIVFESLSQKSIWIMERNIKTTIQDSGAEVQDCIIDLTEQDKLRHCQEIQARCLDTWSESSFKPSTSSKSNLPLKVKSSQTILGGMSLTEYRIRNNFLAGQGAKTVISELLHKAGAKAEIQGTSLDLINQLRRWISLHRKPTATVEGSVVVLPATIVSSELTFRAILTLEEGRWINSEVINSYLVLHSVATGASCDQFPDPLDGPSKVFYADTSFIQFFVVHKRKWRFNLFDFDYLIVPCHVNASHYITLVVKVAAFHLESWDSLGDSQDYLRQIMLEWLRAESEHHQRHSTKCIASSWTSRAVACPQQGNIDDCAVFALLAATYAHLEGEMRVTAYGQGDISLLRKQLVVLPVLIGNLFREGPAWAPFQILTGKDGV